MNLDSMASAMVLVLLSRIAQGIWSVNTWIPLSV